jgi:hypothetical protein
VTLHIVISNKFADFEAKVKQVFKQSSPLIDMEDIGGEATYRSATVLGREIHLIWFKTYTMGNVAHECLHCAWDVLTSRGVPCEENNDEVFAYLTGFLVDAVVAKLGTRSVGA